MPNSMYVLSTQVAFTRKEPIQNYTERTKEDIESVFTKDQPPCGMNWLLFNPDGSRKVTIMLASVMSTYIVERVPPENLKPDEIRVLHDNNMKELKKLKDNLHKHIGVRPDQDILGSGSIRL